ncbi:MAG: carbohydrate kinase [Candidatus Thiodiazotropha sp.]|jgi:fructokinase
MAKNYLTVYGEVLFDCFPEGEKVLGGAPFNVAWHLQAFGQSPHFISRVGEDAEGETIRRAMTEWGMNTDGLQQDSRHPTGRVIVSLEKGEPSYNIVANSAYDFIDSALLKGETCCMLYHGTLGLRSETARSALAQIKSQGSQRIFMDVNLRTPWWRRDEVLEWVAQADWVKLNQDELNQLHGHSPELLTAAADFKAIHGLQGLIVTRGAEGAIALQDALPPLDVLPEKHSDTVDTVGAGDAFSSVLLLGLILEWPLQTTLERAQAFASAIVGQRGATVASPSFYHEFLDQWDLLPNDLER